jgi:hypothetical protein
MKMYVKLFVNLIAGAAEPDLQEVQPADLQRHSLLPLLHVALRFPWYGSRTGTMRNG